MKIETEDKLIVDRLCEQSSVDLYELHVEYRLSPAQLLLAVERLRELGIAQLEGTEVRRSPMFESNVIRLRHAIFNRTMPWKAPPRSARY